MLALRRQEPAGVCPAAPLSVNPVITGGPAAGPTDERGTPGRGRTAASGQVPRQRAPDCKQRGYVSGSAPEPPVSNSFQKRVFLSASALRGIPSPQVINLALGINSALVGMLQSGGKEPLSQRQTGRKHCILRLGSGTPGRGCMAPGHGRSVPPTSVGSLSPARGGVGRDPPCHLKRAVDHDRCPQKASAPPE